MLNNEGLPKYYRVKANILYISIFVIFSALLYQLVRIQIIGNDIYSDLAASQQNKKLEIPTSRGTIFDRNGTKLAESIQISSVFADPSLIDDNKKIARIMSVVLQLETEDVINQLNANKDRKFVWLKRRITDRQAEIIDNLKLRGIGLKDEYKRVYPYGKLCSHVVGFTDIDENGLEGIENSLNQSLSGDKGYKIIKTDGRRRNISSLDEETVFARYGDSVYLTIDYEVQSIVEDELEKACLKWQPESATAIVVDPYTGEILAMANQPSYDPNFIQDSIQDERRNRAITDSFEPGSLIKPIIVSSALNSGLVTEDQKLFCYNGAYRVKKRVIRDVHPHDYLTVSEILINSSNIGMAQLGMLIEKERLYGYLKNFAFGEKTALGLSGESKGIVRPLNRWTTSSTISVAFGYEIAVTPIQLVMAFCTIANGGMLLDPQIVYAITDFEGKEIKEKKETPVCIRRVISHKIAREVMDPILENVVEVGTGRKAMLFEYKIAGKTGTTKKLEEKDGKYVYSDDKYIGSFIGYAPDNNPKICVFVALNEPKNGSYYGGTVAAPVVKEIVKRVLKYMHVEPQYIRTVQS